MEYIKMQVACIAVLLYIAFIYLRECKIYKQDLKNTLFDELLMLGIGCVIVDAITAYTVNHLDTIPPVINKFFHMMFLIGVDAVIFVLCLYMFYITGAQPRKKIIKAIVYGPFVVCIIMIVCNMGSLEYRTGTYTNYSAGLAAYTCFFMAGFYILLSMAVFFKRWNYLEQQKRVSVLTYLCVIACVTGVQMYNPEVLATSLAITICVLGVYMNLEDPVLKELAKYHSETVMAFANLIEKRDDSTGGHVKRTSEYVQLIGERLQQEGRYADILTKDYITNLKKAAPMHDIGKVSVPDAILRKPGKLTDEEFAIMKLHAPNGGKIIQETFCNLGNDDYRKIAYEVARFHHEKWNGRGYPEGIKGEEIPLCARIMAVADVFDAVSEKRCYRDAMPLDECFAIIEKGKGEDFDPVIAQAFLDIRDKVEKVHSDLNLAE